MKSVLITGASRGIGAATARLFSEKGWRVIINYNRSEAEALSLAAELGAEAVRADVSKSDEVNAMAAAAGSVDVLVNNAGICGFHMLDAMSDEDWDRIMGINLTGVFYCTRAFLPQMIRRKGGAIVNVSSMWGICGAACEAAYSASKAGVIGLTKALAKELGPSNIRVNCVAPGAIDTDMNKALTPEARTALCEETPLGRLGTAEEIARAIYFLSDTDSFITGQIISPNGGLVI
ncbi:MAG: 3-oxoacyl-ACP reductase FabG [Clostridia bacterium]|nr:3-oxoacyl-ACP reductase FabG [Clostridia bacterium]